jgi:hypothetical protein
MQFHLTCNLFYPSTRNQLSTHVVALHLSPLGIL